VSKEVEVQPAAAAAAAPVLLAMNTLQSCQSGQKAAAAAAAGLLVYGLLAQVPRCLRCLQGSCRCSATHVLQLLHTDSCCQLSCGTSTETLMALLHCTMSTTFV
jgi:hypothetical protein